jgi:hypothetical protein
MRRDQWPPFSAWYQKCPPGGASGYLGYFRRPCVTLLCHFHICCNSSLINQYCPRRVHLVGPFATQRSAYSFIGLGGIWVGGGFLRKFCQGCTEVLPSFLNSTPRNLLLELKGLLVILNYLLSCLWIFSAIFSCLSFIWSLKIIIILALIIIQSAFIYYRENHWKKIHGDWIILLAIAVFSLSLLLFAILCDAFM